MSYKILVVADSHGAFDRLSKIVAHEAPFDALLHCGDGANDLRRVSLPEEAIVLRVAGNIDLCHGYVFERIIVEELFGMRFMITHGDLFKVEHDLEEIIAVGKTQKADIVCFGHTHIKLFRNGSPVLFNPGPADKGLYGVITIDDKILFSHRAL